MRIVSIAGKKIGNGKDTFVIAEAGINHNGDLGLAKKMVKEAKKAGADAIKFQSFKADEICDKELSEVKDVEGITGGTKSSYDMYKQLEISDEGHKALMAAAQEEGIIFLSSVFDIKTAVYLNDLGMPAFKISSGDVTFIPLLKSVARFKKPVILSTGMAYLSEVALAVETILKEGNEEIILLHCNANYPPPEREVNLQSIISMQRMFDLPVGSSDHTKGIAVSLGAVGLGACVIEKHFTLDNALAGPDHFLSLNPRMFKEMAEGIRAIDKAQGSPVKAPSKTEEPNMFPGRRSLFAAVPVKKGEVLSYEKIKMIKPAKGLPTNFLDAVAGRKATKDIPKYGPITWDCI